MQVSNTLMEGFSWIFEHGSTNNKWFNRFWRENKFGSEIYVTDAFYSTQTVYVVPLKTLTFSPDFNVLVAANKDMWAVKLCSNKILHLLTGSASYHRLSWWREHESSTTSHRCFVNFTGFQSVRESDTSWRWQFTSGYTDWRRRT